ncbi:MAG TPA: ABC transporter permease [Silvibacterium sp.]|nr:ABC transporter permease [Silvibacterium sp.]
MATAVLALQPRPLGLRYYARVIAQETRYEFLKLFRAKAFSLSVIGFPVMFYVIFGLTNHHTEYARYLLASYSCFGMVGAALFGLGAGIAMERAQGWLELKQASPMPRFAYLIAKTVACAAIALITVAILLALGLTMAGVTMSALEAIELIAITLAGAVPFAAMGLLISFILPPNAGAGMINIIYLPMSYASGLWMPINMLPHWVQRLAPALPTYHYAQLALNIFGYAQPSGSMLLHWEALIGFTCLLLGAAWLVFTRSEATA